MNKKNKHINCWNQFNWFAAITKSAKTGKKVKV